MLHNFEKTMKQAASQRQNPANPALLDSETLTDKTRTIKACLNKWRDAIKEMREMFFLETMFRCGEINSLRRHFQQWKRLHQ